MAKIQIIIAVAGLTLATPAAAQDISLPWLVGTWCTQANTKGRVTCETWVAEKDALVGASEARTADAPPRALEQMRITAEPGRLVFRAAPAGQTGADFHTIGAQPPQSLRFENAAHDYPQVIRYWREGETLMAEISLADGSKPMRWTFQRER